jgi:hypothetical protein
VRRILLVLLGLSLLGFVVAAASSVSTNSEDIESFSTQVSISVPTTTVPPPQPLGPTIFLTGQGTLVQTMTSNNTNTARIANAIDSVYTQSTPGSFFTFEGSPAPAAGFLLQGYVTLRIDQDKLITDRLTAALLDCPDLEPNASVGCTPIGTAAVAEIAAGSGNGFKERTVHFGFIDYVIPAGRELRLKIVNRPPASTAVPDFRISYGFNNARPSQLTISATPP